MLRTLNQWAIVWLLSTVMWAASAHLGLWLIHTVWLLVLVLLWAGIIFSIATKRNSLNLWTIKAIGFGLVASIAGPVTVYLMQAIGQRL